MTKDAIIVLGGGIKPDGELPETPKLRIQKGIELYKQGVAPELIISTKWSMMYDYIPPRTEAAAMKAIALDAGVPEEHIHCEEESLDTIGNAYFTKDLILKHHKWKDLTIVSSFYHQERVEYIFKRILGSDYTFNFVGSEDGVEQEELNHKKHLQSVLLQMTKTFFHGIEDGDDEAFHERLFSQHPAYAENPPFTIQQLVDQFGKIH